MMKRLLSVWLMLGVGMYAESQFYDSTLASLLPKGAGPFVFGVASGDPDTGSVVLWTKLYLEKHTEAVVHWQIATDTFMKNVIQQGELATGSDDAYSVKVRVKNLLPGTTYFYRFYYLGQASPVGRTRTAPLHADSLRFAVVSCSHYEAGFFNAYRLICKEPELGAVIHLGDYIYERGAPPDPAHPKIRSHVPPREIITLQDYRTRYAQYRLDADLQEVHRLHPFIATWDDHEFANNAYAAGAENHQPDEGDWNERKKIARKAYFEWMPIMADSGEPQVIRRFDFGGLAALWMLDTRIEARAAQRTDPNDPALRSPAQTILGRNQADWLIEGLLHSPARWKLIGNQVVFSDFSAGHVSRKYQRNLDAWDGYPADRERILDSLYANNIENVIVLTGDVHTSWAFDLARYPHQRKTYRKQPDNRIIGAEFVAMSVTSANGDERVGKFLAKIAQSALKNRFANPHLRYVNLTDHGYMLLELTREYTRCTWKYVRSVRYRSDEVARSVTWQTDYGNLRLYRIKAQQSDNK
ncbi:MAG: alkaline phosphatase D family protein [Chitinophagales bacterium]|nr:alkaline phosphatase D family protein [Chitinophagales bacterium]MDW8419221.1 alkaline phosphatase D family protein [Chitinophagales bacterium]